MSRLSSIMRDTIFRCVLEGLAEAGAAPGRTAAGAWNVAAAAWAPCGGSAVSRFAAGRLRFCTADTAGACTGPGGRLGERGVNRAGNEHTNNSNAEEMLFHWPTFIGDLLDRRGALSDNRRSLPSP